MTYKDLDSQLTGRNAQRRKLANNTYAIRLDSSRLAIRLHQTDILTFHANGRIDVKTGGWKTHTTKDRLNGYLPAGFYISQKNGSWYWGKRMNAGHYDGGLFSEGDYINTKGILVRSAKDTDEQKEKQLRKKVNAYARLYAEQAPLERPGAGDCFHCAQVVAEGPDKGKTLGDAFKDKSHLQLHMDEGYVVPALAYNALNEAKCGPIIIQACFKNPDDKNSEWGKSLIKSYLPRAVRRYILRRLGMAA